MLTPFQAGNVGNYKWVGVCNFVMIYWEKVAWMPKRDVRFVLWKNFKLWVSA